MDEHDLPQTYFVGICKQISIYSPCVVVGQQVDTEFSPLYNTKLQRNVYTRRQRVPESVGGGGLIKRVTDRGDTIALVGT